MNATTTKFGFLSPPKAPGELGGLGPYRVLKVIGQGGMGVVFLAEDPQLERTVALKAMLPEAAKKGTAKERFLREARATAKIEHDHIVTIYQVGEDRGVPFLAMQLLKGTSLEDYLAKKHGKTGAPLPVDQILKLGREIAKGLAAAHEQGLIHRDIKPANIWLDATAGGRVKILDFGLARATESESQLTQLGSIVGTATYMAPEQARGAKIDGRADLFSLGCILYRLCTGRLPRRGGDFTETLLAIATETPTPIEELNPDLPPELINLVVSLLARKPEDRPASAKAVAEAILAIERSQANAQIKPLTAPVAMIVAPQDLPQALVRTKSQSTTRTNKPLVANLQLPARRRPWLLIGGTIGTLGLGLAALILVLSGKDTAVTQGTARNDPPPPSETRPQPTQGQPTGLIRPPDSRRSDTPWIPGELKLIPITPGSFMMGAEAAEGAKYHRGEETFEGQRHQVKLTRPFAMGKFPVTVGQFRKFVSATQFPMPAGGKNWDKPGFAQTEDSPVVFVSWNDAEKFCEWLSAVEHKKYRLPTEAEWEYCCRASTQTPYYFENAGSIRNFVWFRDNSEGRTRPVNGNGHANKWDLHDMLGNVCQWTHDWYDQYPADAVENPTGLVGQDLGAVVLRGGSFRAGAGDCRCASRRARPKEERADDQGFRVVCENP